ncbi:hypothetical protein [Haloarcula sebkhae]|uniref:Uncharacterized protein n=2 Tax=Haloarcula sebkhae TaxID=932660 RepID=A0ACC6VJM2_9EURY|nr:hypothetical protein [Haloarcula sebkhae]GGK74628.1 hypothetical protein GCM10009067_28550 [Haloarcula sebkhae]
MQRPQRPYRALRATVGTAVIATVTALWAHGQLTDNPLGTLWEVVILAIVIAAGFAVFGRRTFGAALDEAEQVKGGDGDDDE